MYFKSFPKTLYAFDLQSASPEVVTNIFARFKLRSDVLTNAYAFYKYQLIDGDTPEIVAYKQYGDATYHWIICLVNGLNDPQFDFPLPRDILERKIIKQYDLNAIEDAYSTIHHYELEVVNTLNVVNGATTTETKNYTITLDQYNYSTNALSTIVLNTPTTQVYPFKANNSDPNSANTSVLTVKQTYRSVDVYTHEDQLNEAKREIKLLKSQYIAPLLIELETVLNG